MAEIKKLMEKDENNIDRQFFPETVPEAIIGLETIVKEGAAVLSVNGKIGAVIITKKDLGLEHALTELPYASEEKDGIITSELFRKILNGTSGTYILPVANAERLGGIKIGSLLEITEEGVLSAIKQTEANFTEELKTKLTSLKMLKAGANISISEDGVISSTGGSETGGVNQTYVDQKIQEVLEQAQNYTNGKIPNFTFEKIEEV
ncbi:MULTISPECIES: hypothetical protein [unclassified Enterococcus]|uniref:hypothetical protein n=1 Tax=unclassified Enterococcus TaxID=2608891 RepID=UPI003F2644EA